MSKHTTGTHTTGTHRNTEIFAGRKDGYGVNNGPGAGERERRRKRERLKENEKEREGDRGIYNNLSVGRRDVVSEPPPELEPEKQQVPVLLLR